MNDQSPALSTMARQSKRRSKKRRPKDCSLDPSYVNSPNGQLAWRPRSAGIRRLWGKLSGVSPLELINARSEVKYQANREAEIYGTARMGGDNSHLAGHAIAQIRLGRADLNSGAGPVLSSVPAMASRERIRGERTAQDGVRHDLRGDFASTGEARAGERLTWGEVDGACSRRRHPAREAWAFSIRLKFGKQAYCVMEVTIGEEAADVAKKLRELAAQVEARSK